MREDDDVMSWDMNDQDTVADVHNTEAGLRIPGTKQGQTRVMPMTFPNHATRLLLQLVDVIDRSHS